jgi:hypothetical protein
LSKEDIEKIDNCLIINWLKSIIYLFWFLNHSANNNNK